MRTIILLISAVFISGCVTKIENTYTINGDSNSIKATDAVSATPTNRDLVDLVGSGYGSAAQGGGK